MNIRQYLSKYQIHNRIYIILTLHIIQWQWQQNKPTKQAIRTKVQKTKTQHTQCKDNQKKQTKTTTQATLQNTKTPQKFKEHHKHH
jgi:hypothetical protein